MPDTCLRTAAANKALQEAVAQLESVRFWQGFQRFSILGIGTLSCLTLAWVAAWDIGFWVWTVIGGVFYALWLICTHDATHHTLLGRPALEDVLARAISWPMLWPVGTYAELHRLHHGWNGLDLRDPERYQWSESDYQQAPPWTQWYIRHQWVVHIFVLGGLGIIIKTQTNGQRFQKRLPGLRRQLYTDLLGITLVQMGLITVVILTDTSLSRYLLFWFCLERVVGAIAQTRAHLEHYGLWQQADGHLLTQLYSARNLQTAPWFSWLIGGLNYHAVHHAFPKIPFNQLPEAHKRVQAILDQHGMPAMKVEPGYLSAVRTLISQFTLISESLPERRPSR